MTMILYQERRKHRTQER